MLFVNSNRNACAANTHGIWSEFCGPSNCYPFQYCGYRGEQMSEQTLGILIIGGVVVAFAGFVSYMADRQQTENEERKKTIPRRLRMPRSAVPRRAPKTKCS